jgi:hypothetical protein
MRRILVDHARRRGAGKRERAQDPVFMETCRVDMGCPDIDLLAVDLALDRLAKIDPRKSQVIELRIFAGLSLEETAEAMNVARLLQLQGSVAAPDPRLTVAGGL